MMARNWDDYVDRRRSVTFTIDAGTERAAPPRGRGPHVPAGGKGPPPSPAAVRDRRAPRCASAASGHAMRSHRPVWGGCGRLHWVTCACGSWQSGAYRNDAEAHRAYTAHLVRLLHTTGATP